MKNSLPALGTLSSARTIDGKPFFVWLNTTQMHFITHTRGRRESLRIIAAGRGKH